MTPTSTAAARVSGTIKALEWLDHPSGSKCLTDDHYSIALWANERPHPLYVRKYTTMRRSKTLEAAKAAAQADYDSRLLAEIQPDPEPQPVAWAVAVIARKEPQIGYRVRLSSAATEDEAIGESMRVFGELNPGWEIMQPAALPIHTTPSSAGTVSVEAAARPMSDIPEDGTWALLYPGYYGPVTACVMNGEWSLFNDAEKPHVTHWVEIQPALRALAGEGGR